MNNTTVSKIEKRIMRTSRKMWDLCDKRRDVRGRIGWGRPNEDELKRQYGELNAQIAVFENEINADNLLIHRIRYEQVSNQQKTLEFT